MFGYLIGIPTSRFLNYITVVQMRRAAFGNDSRDRVTHIASVPESFSKDYGLVPEQLEVALAAFSDKLALKHWLMPIKFSDSKRPRARWMSPRSFGANVLARAYSHRAIMSTSLQS
jgi:hypothetical protein